MTRFLYTGQVWDADVGLQYNWNRWYDPAVGRWISEDPMGFAAGDANLNRYVANESVVLNDPSGEIAPVVVGVVIVVYWFWPDTANAPGPDDGLVPSDPYEGMPYAAAAGLTVGGGQCTIRYLANRTLSGPANGTTTHLFQRRVHSKDEGKHKCSSRYKKVAQDVLARYDRMGYRGPGVETQLGRLKQITDQLQKWGIE